MSVAPELLSQVITAAGGRVVGRIRMQKMLYLLDQLGLNSGAAYYYHHYGPYSDDVSNAIADGKFFGQFDESMGYRQADGAPFSIFSQKANADNHQVAAFPFAQLAGQLNQQSSSVLELAATIHWLAQVEQVPDWRVELIARKGTKASDLMIEKALQLLQSLNLAPG